MEGPVRGLWSEPERDGENAAFATYPYARIDLTGPSRRGNLDHGSLLEVFESFEDEFKASDPEPSGTSDPAARNPPRRSGIIGTEFFLWPIDADPSGSCQDRAISWKITVSSWRRIVVCIRCRFPGSWVVRGSCTRFADMVKVLSPGRRPESVFPSGSLLLGLALAVSPGVRSTGFSQA